MSLSAWGIEKAFLTITITNNDRGFLRTYNLYDMAGDPRIPLSDQYDDLHDSYFSIILDGEFKTRLFILEGASKSVTYALNPLKTYRIQIISWDNELGLLRIIADDFVYLPNYGAQRTYVKTQSPSFLSVDANVMYLLVNTSDVGNLPKDEFQDYFSEKATEVRQTAEKADAYLDEVSNSYFRYRPRAIVWGNAYKNTSTTELFSDADFRNETGHYKDDLIKKVALMALYDVDHNQGYSFLENNIQKVIFVFPTITEERAVAMSKHVFVTDDIPMIDNVINGRYFLNNRLIMIYGGFLDHPYAYVHEIFHEYNFGDSYYDKDYAQDNNLSMDDFYWWGIMGGTVGGQLTSYHKWALGWMDAVIIPYYTSTDVAYFLPPLYEEKGNGERYYATTTYLIALDPFNTSFLVLEHRLKDTNPATFQSEGFRNQSGRIVGDREFVMYAINSSDYHWWTDNEAKANDFLDYQYITTRNEIMAVNHLILDNPITYPFIIPLGQDDLQIQITIDWNSDGTLLFWVNTI